MQMTPHFWQKRRGTKSLLMKVKEESGKVGLKLTIQKTRIMASGPITSWEIDGETMQHCQSLFWGAPISLQMVIAAMKLRRLFLGRKVMIYLDSILKSRDITLQHTRPPCPSPPPGIYSNSCPLSWWSHPTIYLIICRPLLLPPSIFPSIRVFSNESFLRLRWPKYWNFSFNISPSNEYFKALDCKYFHSSSLWDHQLRLNKTEQISGINLSPSWHPSHL